MTRRARRIEAILRKNPTWTLIQACEKVGISTRTAYRDGAKHPDPEPARQQKLKHNRAKTRQELIRSLKVAEQELGRVPKMADFYGVHVSFYRHFGSWPQALAAAGIIPCNPGATRRTDKEILASIKEYATELGRTPSCTDFIRATPDAPCIGTITRRFGTWTAAVQAAGLTPRMVRFDR